MSVSSTNVNPTRLYLYRDNGASNFIPLPDPSIILIIGALTVTQIVEPDTLPWQITWKGTGNTCAKIIQRCHALFLCGVLGPATFTT